jgi:hypothetical protein
MMVQSNAPSYQILCLILLLALGCVPLSVVPTPTPTSTPTPQPSPTRTNEPLPTLRPTPRPSLTPEPPDTGWQTLQPGIELRQIRVDTDAGAEGAERLLIIRIASPSAHFRVHYDPTTPRPISAWARHLQPLIVVNGSYFTPENETVGLLISSGQVWGTPYGDFAGLFAVRDDGEVSIRWLRDRPYDPAEPLREALQSFPVLVKPGGVMGFPADADDGRPARRTVVGQDRQKRVLFIVAPRGYLGLHQLACFLVESDLDLDVALNLDGGLSTGIWLREDTESVEPVEIDSLVPVPSVIAVYYHQH